MTVEILLGEPTPQSLPASTPPPPLPRDQVAKLLLLYPLVSPEEQPTPHGPDGRPNPGDGVMRGPGGVPLRIAPHEVAPVVFDLHNP
ncbi:MAG: hypothetical protein ACREQ5_07625 [Candidatus Dormibacteria bacterium]